MQYATVETVSVSWNNITTSVTWANIGTKLTPCDPVHKRTNVSRFQLNS